MKKIFSLFTVAFISMFALVLGVNAKELSAYDQTGSKITLTEDSTVSSAYTVPSNVEVLDLGGKTLTLKKGIKINSTLEIKNGTIERDASFTTNSMIVVDGATVDFTLDGVTIDGKEVSVTHPAGEQGSALLVKSGKDITLNDSTIVNHVFSFAGIVSVFNSENIYVINTKISDNKASNVGTLTVAYSDNFEFYADSIISNNVAQEAAGIHVEYTNSTIAGTIEGNKTTATDGNGGGLYVFLNDQKGTNSEEKTVIIAETAKIINNTAEGAGGGVYVNGVKSDSLTGKVIMMGGLISGNTAKGTPAVDTLKDGGGAGVYVARGNMEINGGTIENNTSTSGVGDAILVSNAGKNNQSGNLEITGGTVDGKIAMSTDNGDITVSGGSFTDNVNAYIASNVDKVEIDGITYVGDSYEITIEKTTNGAVTSVDKAVVGQPVKLTVKANEGYELVSIKVVDKDGKEVKVTDNTFEMPDSDVTVTATFEAAAKGTKNPATGDNTAIYMVLGIIGLMGAAVTTKKLRNN